MQATLPRFLIFLALAGPLALAWPLRAQAASETGAADAPASARPGQPAATEPPDEAGETAPETAETADKAETAGPAESAAKNPDILKLKGVTVDRKKREIRVNATVCLDSGILEYVICLPDTFEHEAIFVTEARPELLHATLLLLGVEPNPLRPGLEALWWERALKSPASRVGIDVQWGPEDQPMRFSLASMLRKRVGGEDYMGWEDPEPAPASPEDAEVAEAWVFTGSFFHTNGETGERVYAANLGGVLVGIWPNPSAVIQYGKPSENPYRGAGMGMEVNEETVPQSGTEVELIFFPYRSEDEAGMP